MNPSDLLPLLPEITLAIGGMVALMVGVFMSSEGAARRSLIVSLVVMVLAGIFLWSSGAHESGALPFNGLLRQDGFGVFVKSLCLIGGGISLLMGWQWLEAESLGKFEIPVLVVFSILGMWLMVDANSLLSLYVGLELQSLCLFVLAAINRENRESAEAGLKYFLLGALSSGLLLYGASLVYGTTGSLGFTEIAAFVKSVTTDPSALPISLLIGMILVISGLAFKISAVPFHMWTPDVYEGSPTPVTGFFAVAPKVAAMALLVRILLGPFAEMQHAWHQIILLLTLLSMLLGAFAAITQSSIKRLLAYSSIANMGYAMIGLTVGTSDGIASLLLYLAIYAVMTIGAFGTILLLRRGGVSLDRLSDLAGLGRHHPKTAFALAVFMFSMTGIPP
ncbi:MAG: NADH-quinone oxidoreductase subunit N, partial [Alphaproteobacteria bacterium]|nr:NADH-quinone oxidoreductase subunit N [Alphaproteobacteria bacterium]